MHARVHMHTQTHTQTHIHTHTTTQERQSWQKKRNKCVKKPTRTCKTESDWEKLQSNSSLWTTAEMEEVGKLHISAGMWVNPAQNCTSPGCKDQFSLTDEDKTVKYNRTMCISSCMQKVLHHHITKGNQTVLLTVIALLLITSCHIFWSYLSSF